NWQFRHLGHEARAEAVQEVAGLTWKFWLMTARRGRDGEPGMLASIGHFAIKQARAGRSIGRDVGREGDGRRQGLAALYARGRPADSHQVAIDLFASDATPPPDLAAFAIDTAAFLATLKPKQRAMALGLASGAQTQEVARAVGVTPGAISQFRHRFR